jgi:hypothetical protein
MDERYYRNKKGAFTQMRAPLFITDDIREYADKDISFPSLF